MHVDFLEHEAVWRIADDFRQSPALQGYNIPPIDVMFVVDVQLGFDVIEIDDLFDDLRMDAAIVPAEKTLYIDRHSLDQWEQKKGWIEKRLRFTLAHELGHYFLHRAYLADLSFNNLPEFKRLMLAHGNNRRLEEQANEFAGRFLVPPDLFRQEYNVLCSSLTKANVDWRVVPGMREYFAKKMAPRFGVNAQVIETRLDHEGLWPQE